MGWLEENISSRAASSLMNMEWNGVDDDNSSPTSEQHMLTEKRFLTEPDSVFRIFFSILRYFSVFRECSEGVRAREDNTGAREFINYELLEAGVVCLHRRGSSFFLRRALAPRDLCRNL